jgi:hypothetical protein
MLFIGRRVFVICFVFVSCTFPEKYGPVLYGFHKTRTTVL